MSSSLSAQQLARIRSKLEQQLPQASARHAQAVEAALQRIKLGEYGVCVDCGEEISAARLAMKPEVALCADCQALADDES